MPASSVTIAKERKALMELMDTGDYKVPNRRIDENILIASWNIQNFSNKKTIRALQYIADICERFDIVALQEVKTDLRGLSKLQERLPGNYKIPPPGWVPVLSTLILAAIILSTTGYQTFRAARRNPVKALRYE